MTDEEEFEEVDDFDLFIEEKNNRIKELEKENEELNIENGALNTQKNKLIEHNAELFLENEDLKSQIEKMKCCENCRFWQDNDCIVEHDYDCKRWNNTNTDDFWELAE